MADEFDPYYTWLGIRPEEQPADHYRLIGLRQFEDHADVISNALDQKMQFVRTMQVGKRSAISQKLLNEISAAGGVLLDPKKKKAYDADLRSKEEKKNAAQASASKPLPKPVSAPINTLPPAAAPPLPAPLAPRPKPIAMPQQPVVGGPKVEISAARPSLRPAASWTMPLILVGGVLAMVVVGGVLVFASGILGSGERKIASTPVKKVTTSGDSKGIKPAPEVKPTPTKPTPEVNPEIPKPPDRDPTKVPATTNPGTKPALPGTKTNPPVSAEAWWKDPSHVGRLLALQIGTDAYAEFPDSASQSTLATPLTAELWLRLHMQGDQPARILGTILGGEGVVPKGWGLIVRRVGEQEKARDQLYVEFWKPNNEYVHYPLALLDGESWHHIAVVLEPEKPGKIFVDGKPTEFSEAKGVTSSQRNLALGAEMQPSDANFKAEICGLRVSQSARYSAAFSPPSPLDMNPDETTFAALDCRMYQTAATTPDKPYPWLYGVGKFDVQSKRIVNFQPLRYGTARQWQGGKSRPDNKLDWIALDPFGGCPGKGQDQLAVRRWVAPADGEVSVSGRLRHFHSWRAGDGVTARIVSSSSGSAGEWRVHFRDVETAAQGLKVQSGDTIDFVVDCENNSDCDIFDWIVDLKLVDGQQRIVGTWNSARDFRVIPAPSQAAASLREPTRNKAQWIPLQDFAIILRSTREAGGGDQAQLVAQSAPLGTNPPPLTLKPVPAKPPSPFGDPMPPAEVPTANKPAVPDAAALAKAKTEVLQVFGDDLQAAKAPKQKQELAQKMLDLVKDTADSATKFALLEEVRRLAIQGHDTDLALGAVSRLVEQFDVDSFAMTVKVIEGLAAEGLTPAQRGDALSAACDFGYEAMEADRFEALQAVVAAARSMAVKATTAESKVTAKEFFDSYAKKQKLIDAIKKAEQTIATAPNEPGANQTLGLYYAFTRGDQKKGLPMLAKATDQKLAAAAKLREQNLAKGTAASLEEADAWFEAAGTAPADYKLGVQKLALEGYSVLASSGTGLEKVKAEKRHGELAASIASAPMTKGSRPKASDFPEFSSGMVGRVLVNGRDAGALVTFQPGRRVNTASLNEILDKSKASGLRVIVEGYVSCAVETQILIHQQGQSNGPGQIVSVDGKPVNAVGGATGRSSQSHFMSLAAGEHLVQWAFDYGRTTEPSMRIASRDRGEPILVRYTRQQAMAARKPATTAEVVLSN